MKTNGMLVSASALLIAWLVGCSSTSAEADLQGTVQRIQAAAHNGGGGQIGDDDDGGDPFTQCFDACIAEDHDAQQIWNTVISCESRCPEETEDACSHKCEAPLDSQCQEHAASCKKIDECFVRCDPKPPNGGTWGGGNDTKPKP